MKSIEEMIKELCPEGVEYVKLGDLLDYEQPSKYIVKSTEYDNSYSIPVLTAGQSFLLGYTDETDGIFSASKENPTIIFDDFTTGFHWVDFSFKVKSSAMKMLKPKADTFSFRYVYLAMQCINFVPTEHSRHWISKYSQFQIPLPPLPIQQQIVNTLDKFTSLISNLDKQIELRQKQYEYYREKLLTFSEDDESVEWKSLSEVCDYVDYRGKTPKKTEKGIFLVTAKNIRMGYIDYENSKEYIAPEDYSEVMRRGLPQKGDVLITTEAPCGYVAQVDREDIALAQRVIKYRTKARNLDNTYLKYVLMSNNMQSKILSNANGGTVKGIKGSVLYKIIIPIPSLSRQQEIVSTLDKFEAVLANLKRERELRQKQYEYYREKLLTF